VFSLLAAAAMLILATDTPDEVYRRAALDLAERVPPEKRRVTRYLSLHAVPADERWKFVQALDFAVNSVSFRSQIVHPALVDADRLLYRVDLQSLGWDIESRRARIARLKLSGVDFKLAGEAERLFADVWEAFARDDPYFKVSQVDGKGKLVRGWLEPVLEERTRRETYSSSFILRADWLLPRLLLEKQQGGYYSAVLMLPGNEADLYRYVGVDSKFVDRDPQLKVGGATLGPSIVALHNRELQLRPNLYGYDEKAFWVTFDVLNDADKARNVLETFGGKIKHDGREVIFTLPNGLHAYSLFDGAGKQVAVVPQAIALDMRPKSLSRDRNVLNAIACISCHGPVAGIQPFVDPVRKGILDAEIGLAVVTNDKRRFVEVTEDLEAYYRLAEKGGIERDVTRQQESYARRVLAVNELDPKTNAERVMDWFNRYIHDLVTPEMAAADMGLPVAEARALWRTSGNSQLVALSGSGSPAIRRAGWEGGAYGVAMREQTFYWESTVNVGGK
jgi:hypothetical protein